MPSVFVLGFGKVGRWLVRLLLEEYSEEFNLIGVTSSKGTVLPEGPADKAALLRLARSGGRLEEHPSFLPGLLAPDAPVSAGPDIVFVAIPPSYGSGEPNRSIYRAILEEGISIVTAEKSVLALDFKGTVSLAIESGAGLAFRATVMAGTPALDVAAALQYRGVEEARSVLNATSNYVLGLVEKGLSLEEAVERSIQAGLAEPDPSIDLDGWDAAAKLAILANVLGYEATLRDVERVPLSKALGQASAGTGRLKQVASLRAGPGRLVLRVAPELVPPDDPLASAEGEENVLVLRLEGDRIVLRGPAGPAWRTARVMIGDALELSRGGRSPIVRPGA